MDTSKFLMFVAAMACGGSGEAFRDDTDSQARAQDRAQAMQQWCDSYCACDPDTIAPGVCVALCVGQEWPQECDGIIDPFTHCILSTSRACEDDPCAEGYGELLYCAGNSR